jgi:pSer/pThr/pTyr-binding forkhead associated (FHA) protein
MTVLGDVSDSCFGIDKQSPVNAIRIVRINNLCDAEEYLIVIREATIGRSAGNGIVIDHETVSDIHAKLLFREDRYWIEDLNSRHGMAVNGELIAPGREIALDPQTRITLGDVALEFTGR